MGLGATLLGTAVWEAIVEVERVVGMAESTVDEGVVEATGTEDKDAVVVEVAAALALALALELEFD